MPDATRDDPESFRERRQEFRTVVLTGLAIVVPVLITTYVIWFAVSILGDLIQPLVELLELAGVEVLSRVIALLFLIGFVIGVGVLAQYRYGERLVETFDYLLTSIPVIGTVYRSVRRVGDMAFDSDTRDFEGVKLVEMFSEEMYVIAFETTDAPDPIADAVGIEDAISLFVPLAPNPITGGYLTYVPRDRVVDVDMTVEEGIRAVLTSGVAAGETEEGPRRFTVEEVREAVDANGPEDLFDGSR